MEQTKQAAMEGDYDKAEAESLRSLQAFLPAIKAINAREKAKELKEEYEKQDFDHLNLTSREQEIMNQLLAGTTPKEIGYNLQISYPTVNFHMSNLYRKLGIQSRAELFARFGNTIKTSLEVAGIEPANALLIPCIIRN